MISHHLFSNRKGQWLSKTNEEIGKSRELSDKMKNIKDYQMKKCIFVKYDEFTRLVNTLIDDKIQVQFDNESWTGLTYSGEKDYYDNEKIWEVLSEHFGVEVTSVHYDSYAPVGFWIVYED